MAPLRWKVDWHEVAWIVLCILVLAVAVSAWWEIFALVRQSLGR